nr:hypothetical protein FAC10E3_23 [Penicillium camemberti]
MFMDLLDNNLAADEEDDDGEDVEEVEDGEDASENEVTAPVSKSVDVVDTKKAKAYICHRILSIPDCLAEGGVLEEYDFLSI